MKGAVAEQTAIERSRQAILGEIGDAPDLTFIRGPGNHGDELIWAGTRELLSELIYREIDLDGLCAARGHTAVLTGGGGFCRVYREFMPRALEVACLRFERVIVLPTSFDPSEDEVREVLAATRATVFARERESYQRIQPLCDARVAHDCAFFFDYAPHRRQGHGVLNAFRTDVEAISGRSLPLGNDDISATAASFEQWLETIADHELVRTDRAHVMIAAAMMGKRVEFGPSSYHKVPAMVEYALGGYPVSTLDGAVVRSARPRAVASKPSPMAAKVTAVVLTRDRPRLLLRAIDSLRANDVPLHTLVIDNNSAPAAAQELVVACSERDAVSVRCSDRNLGCAAGRQLGVELTSGEFVMFLDDDAELEPGAVDLLVGELSEHPEAAAITATVVYPNGRIHHSGGWLRITEAMAEFGPIAFGLPVEEVPPTGPADWVPGGAVLIRRDVLEAFPIDERMSSYFEDNEWSYRVEQARPGSFRRSSEARAVHHSTPKPLRGVDFSSRSVAVERLRACAHFWARHGKLLNVDLFDLVPELTDGSGAHDLSAAALLMELLLARGPAWTFTKWMNGELDVLLKAGRRLHEARAESERLMLRAAEWEERAAEATRRLSEHAEFVEFLHRRHETLGRVEQGGWWRLRQRALPALRLFWKLKGRGEA